jgi:type II secretory pathway pseudopilin PulG
MKITSANRRKGFTMVEIAISVAVIAFALVAIIGVLPAGLQVQKENREETLIAQDGVYLMDAIRSGAQGLNDLVPFVTRLETNGVAVTDYKTGADVIGLLSTPGTNRAIIRAISGAVSEMGQATEDIAFKYLLEVQMHSFPLPTSPTTNQIHLSEKLHELRLLFRWPVLKLPQPNDSLLKATLGNGRQVSRTIVSGDLVAFTNQNTAYYFLRP